MTIRKLFKYEMSHRVLGAYTDRCRLNNHGHSYKLELFVSGPSPDKGQMLVDFTKLKEYIGPFVDSFDHSIMLWDEDRKDVNYVGNTEIEFYRKYNDRYIIAPFNSTAEMQAKMFLTFSSQMIRYLCRFHKGFVTDTQAHPQAYPTVTSVRVHETDTGYAEAFATDYCEFPPVRLHEIEFSPGIVFSWPPEFRAVYNKLVENSKSDAESSKERR